MRRLRVECQPVSEAATSDFADEIDAHLALEIERLIDEGLTPRARRAWPRRRQFGSVAAAKERFYESRRLLWLDHLVQDLRDAARSVAKYPVAAARRGHLARRRHRRHDRHADDPRRRVPQAAGALPRARGAVEAAGRIAGQPDHADRQPGARPALCDLARRGRRRHAGGRHAGADERRARRRSHRDGAHPICHPGVLRRPRRRPGDGIRVRPGQATTHRTRPRPSSAIACGSICSAAAPTRSASRSGSTTSRSSSPACCRSGSGSRRWTRAIWTRLDPRARAAETGSRSRRPPAARDDARGARGSASARAGRVRERAAGRERQMQAQGVRSSRARRSAHMMPVALPWMLGTAVLLTLLIACANVAILVIAQWTAREHEIAIRASLGASRSRIVRALVTESVVIATLGGLVGVCATMALRGLMVRNGGPFLRLYDLVDRPAHPVPIRPDHVLTGVVSGIGPALLETRRLHGNPMRTLSSSDRVRQRWRHSLVVMEIAVTVALLVVTGSMVTIYRDQLKQDVGFRTHPLIAMRVENSGGVPTLTDPRGRETDDGRGGGCRVDLRPVPGVRSARAGIDRRRRRARCEGRARIDRPGVLHDDRRPDAGRTCVYRERLCGNAYGYRERAARRAPVPGRRCDRPSSVDQWGPLRGRRRRRPIPERHAPAARAGSERCSCRSRRRAPTRRP